ncbi:hypothetical protein [Rhodobacter ferrooxidans]|uniref:Uncharacterized protein n=1 Tax=Rhodobacter ferrooxidans TaxID=371731 RepID=C8RYW8_9RHOB|nr:hypothetical protein [Rhodobacter sp. SW2]EEW25925.1 hypothetical protein Rsw2DRAFT_0996 [Rhodobacter sp. SW2]
MFHIFRPNPDAAAKMHPADAALAPPDSACMMEVIAQVMAGLMQTGSFLGCMNAAAGFQVQPMPNGMQVAASRERSAGVVMAETVVGIQFARATAVRLALVAASVYFKNAFKAEPDWKLQETAGRQKMTADISLNANAYLSVICEDGLVDSQFDGKVEPGATILLELRRKN